MWLFFSLKIWWLLVLSFPQKTAFVQFALIFIVTTLPKFATKNTGWSCPKTYVYQKQNKTMNCFLSNAWWAKVPLSCQLEFWAAFAKVFSVWGKARSMEAYVQCWVGTCFAKYAGSNSDLQEPNWNWVWFSKLKLELNRIFSKRTGPFMCRIGTRIKIQGFEKKWFESRVNQRLIIRNHQFCCGLLRTGLKLGLTFWIGTNTNFPIVFMHEPKLRQF
jgi:hypothetical protein